MSQLSERLRRGPAIEHNAKKNLSRDNPCGVTDISDPVLENTDVVFKGAGLVTKISLLPDA